MTNEQHNALERLREILNEANELGLEARGLIAEHFPHEIARSNAYGLTQFCSSQNPYDVTFEDLVNDIESEYFA